MKILTTYNTHGEEFKIVKFNEFVCSVPTRFIDDNWQTTKILFAKELHPSNSIEECIEWIERDYEIQELRNKGYDAKEIIKIIFNIG